MSCISTMNLCIIRGDSFEFDVGLAQGFEDVALTPLGYRGNMVLRYDQDDSLTPLLTLEATPEPVPPEEQTECDPTIAYLTFVAAPAQTASLPPYDCVYYVELTTVGGSQVNRLFQGKVDIHD